LKGKLIIRHETIYGHILNNKKHGGDLYKHLKGSCK